MKKQQFLTMKELKELKKKLHELHGDPYRWF